MNLYFYSTCFSTKSFFSQNPIGRKSPPGGLRNAERLAVLPLKHEGTVHSHPVSVCHVDVAHRTSYPVPSADSIPAARGAIRRGRATSLRGNGARSVESRIDAPAGGFLLTPKEISFFRSRRALEQIEEPRDRIESSRSVTTSGAISRPASISSRPVARSIHSRSHRHRSEISLFVAWNR